MMLHHFLYLLSVYFVVLSPISTNQLKSFGFYLFGIEGFPSKFVLFPIKFCLLFSSNVQQTKEDVFSVKFFKELNLHPFMVSTSHIMFFSGSLQHFTLQLESMHFYLRILGIKFLHFLRFYFSPLKLTKKLVNVSLCDLFQQVKYVLHIIHILRDLSLVTFPEVKLGHKTIGYDFLP